MSLHADVSVPAQDRRRLERLACYILRSPICLERLEAQPDGRLSYKLKTRWRDGTTHILMERHELLERLAPLIPPPRAHQIRYYGILAPCASGRDRVVPGAKETATAASVAKNANRETPCALDLTRTCRLPNAEMGRGREITPPEGDPRGASGRGSGTSQEAQADSTSGSTQQAVIPRPARPVRRRCLPWADLLKRVFGVEALRCKCGHSMHLIAAITEPTVAKRILGCMGLPPRAPPLAPARTSGLASTTLLEEAEAAGFDQSPPDDWALGA